MTEHAHCDGIVYFCNDKGCTEIKTKSAATQHTERDYNELLRKYHALEGVLANTQYRNSQLQAQVDTNSGEGTYKDYKNLAECMKDQIADDPKHDPKAAERRCKALAQNDISKEGATKSASVNNTPPAYAANFMDLMGEDYPGKHDVSTDNLKSASVVEEGELIGTSFYGTNTASNRIVRVVN